MKGLAMNLRTNLNIWLVACVVLVLVAGPAVGRTIYVDPNGARDYTGIQAAINAAVSGVDQIEVAPGTYYEAINFGGKAIRLYSRGGTEVTTINGTGHYHVVQCISGEGPDTVLEGFTVSRGAAIGSDNNGKGGGMYNTNSSPAVINCRFTVNSASVRGGGIYNANSSPLIENCVFLDNTANGYGGAICNDGGSSPQVVDCIFYDNFAGSGGGGIYSESSSPTITHCSFYGNSTNIDGGGLYNTKGSHVVVARSLFYGNSALLGGGGMYHQGSPGLRSSLTLDNCVFAVNTSEYGGGFYNGNYTRSTEVTNCTFSANVAISEGAGIYTTSDYVLEMRNSILWGNVTGDVVRDQIVWKGSEPNEPQVRYCDIQGGWPGEGNIDDDPRFVFDDDPHLTSESPCVDAWTYGPTGDLPETDLDGKPRVLDGDGDKEVTVDIGAYEYDPNHPFLAVSPSVLRFSGYREMREIEPQLLLLSNCGGKELAGEINYTGQPYWLSIYGAFSVELNSLTLRANHHADPCGMRGDYVGVLQVFDMADSSYKRTVVVNLTVGATLTVDPHDSNNFNDIQSAINEAVDGDVITVADEIYTGGIDFLGKSITVISKNGADRCEIKCDGLDSAFTFENGEGNKSVVEGFKITGAEYCGIYCSDVSPQIRNCKFQDNNIGVACFGSYGVIITGCTFTGNQAGGIYCQQSKPRIFACRFSENDATYGGGISLDECTGAEVVQCQFTGNTANDSGGAISDVDSSSTKIKDCTFGGNTAKKGGAIYFEDSISSPTVMNCNFLTNQAETGGGIYSTNSPLTTANSSFLDNKAIVAAGAGGALYFDVTSASKLRLLMYNNVLAGNQATACGGGLWYRSTGSSLEVMHCTFYGNVAGSGSDIYNDNTNIGSQLDMTNCILWAVDSSKRIVNKVTADVSNVIIRYCDIKGCYDATATPPVWRNELGVNEEGNIESDPRFRSAGSRDFRLKVRSPCVDAGVNIEGMIYSDLRGSLRPIDGNPSYGEIFNNNFDMGAYEYSSYYSGVEDEIVKAFQNVKMPAFARVGTTCKLRWENHPAFPHDIRIDEQDRYEVTLRLVSVDGLSNIYLKDEQVDAQTPPEGNYSTEFLFGPAHVGTWKLRIELRNDPAQYQISEESCYIAGREPVIVDVGKEIKPPEAAVKAQEPEILEEHRDFFYWSEFAGKLYGVAPTTAIIMWTDDNGDPIPMLVTTKFPDDPQIHLTVSPEVELLPPDSSYSFVEIRYATNDASIAGGSRFSANSQGYCVLLYGDDTNYQFDPDFEVVHTVEWPALINEDPCSWAVGSEITDPCEGDGSTAGYVLNKISPYDSDIYDRDERSGQIFAVNLDNPSSAGDDLIVFWYEKGRFGADWPYLPVRYQPMWPLIPEEGLEKIVIASCLGSEVYGQAILDASHRNMQIYNQPDQALPGCNPNEEHAAFLLSNRGVPYQAVYALRNDLNRTDWGDPDHRYTSEPYVLLKYQDIDDRWHYRVFKVIVEEGDHDLRYDTKAGLLMQPPYPIVNLLPGCDGVSYPDMPGPWWVDYNKKIWARCATATEPGTIRWFYQLQPDFWYDLDDNGVQDEPIGTCIAWLDHESGTPVAVAYDVNWPDDVPELEVGETLMKPKHGLPDITNQCSVEIIFDEPNEVYGRTGAVKLIEPLGERSVKLLSLPSEIKVRDKSGMKVFDDLAFHLRTRCYYDPLDQKLIFKGHFDDTVVGEPILLLNVMSDRERDELLDLEKEGDTGSVWDETVKALYEETRNAMEGNQTWLGAGTKALSAGTAGGTGYVTLAFAGDPNCSPLPVSVEVIKVVCGPYRGELKVIESDNVFDERITFRHSGDFGGRPEGRLFQWMYSYSLDEPNEPHRPRPADNWKVWPVEPPNGNAVLDITVGGAGLIAVQDIWFSCRYFDELCGDWSIWTEPQLHESWLKRVNRQVNLFDQRYKDFHEAEINTLVSMVSQIGRRYEGNVALTAEPDSINSVGMLELYETLFRRAAEFSIDASPAYNDAVANRTLLFASSRIAALYTLLGNEAYADALDPTIGFTTEGVDYGVMAPAIHCFQNQTDSLLTEELVLLRGLDSDPYPQPLYNRLAWNFTSGDGEVAYVSNYVTTDMDDDGDIDEYDAAIMYPQGHGDAWGHYLAALKTYYRLLVHPNYIWVPQSEHVLVGGTPVEVDYFDERQFAKIAAAKARTGAEIVDLTYRERFDEDPENQWQGYKDVDSDRAWGVAGWASRAGQGTYFDWVVANALLPDTDPSHSGLQKVDRTTVMETREIAGSFNEIQAKLDMADLGLNPLGVAKDAVPFDINPFELVDALGQPSGRTHFEQVYDRALTALNNALAGFNFANQNTQLLRRQQDTLENFTYNVIQRETDFRNRLIEIYGYPYEDDIGPTGTYPEDYDGPDIYHYMYVDQSELMSSSSPDTIELTVTFKEPYVAPQGTVHYQSKDVVFHLSQNGLGLIKPDSWTGSRRAPGELQMARSDLLQAKANFERALVDYGSLLKQIEDQADILQAQYDLDTTELYILNKTHNKQESLNMAILAARGLELMFRGLGRRAVIAADAAAEFIPTSVGLSTDVGAPARGAAKVIGSVINEVFTTLADTASIGELAAQQAKERAQSLSNIELTAARQEFAELQELKQLEQLVRTEASQRLGLLMLAETMQQSSGRYMAALAKGTRTYEELTRFRKQTAQDIQRYRYKDMTFRVFRNDALQKYRAQFDMAATYAYFAAKAYDYDTALFDSYSAAGQHFLNRIVSQRSIGQVGPSGPIPGGGLAGALAELKLYYDVFKTTMGFNNPQIETTWFSLRKEHFRITEHSASDVDWKKTLDRYYVEDLWDLPEFRRYCKPFDTEEVALPGFVIPFQTNITNGLNFFGWPGGADPFYAPENFATKIRSVGIWFSNYDTSIMSPTPRVYLIPVGQDIVRADVGRIRSWKAVEQSIPVPFQIGEHQLKNNFEWIPLNDSLPGPLAEIRRYSRFRAYPDGGFNPSEMTYDSRLIGRSVWNTRWLLIIPGHSLYLSDPWEGMERFISGAVVPGGDGERTGNGVTDIKLFFKTYAYPGS
jgi:predicted outer membrane repeat protein